MRWACVILSVLACGMMAAAEDAPRQQLSEHGHEEGYLISKEYRWLSKVRSLRLRGALRQVTTAEAIADHRRQIRNQHPEIENPDPLKFPQLLPVVEAIMDDAFDQTRYRVYKQWRSVEGQPIYSRLCFLDGRKSIVQSVDHIARKSQVWSPEAGNREFPFGMPFSLSRLPPGLFWWNNLDAEKEDYRRSFGGPEDLILVGRETFHNVECDVYLNSVGNQSDRYYFGVKDQRCYGAKEGIIAFGDLTQYEERYRAAIEEFLGAEFDGEITSKTWEKLSPLLRKLPQARKIQWCRLLYDRISKNYTPCFEYFLSDFRDLGDGRVMPFHQDVLQYEHEGDTKIFLKTTQSFDIVEIVIDQPLDDRLFQLMPEENEKPTSTGDLDK